jgi:hypothetical protein
MDRPAHTFVLPVPLSRMLAAYTLIRESEPNIGTEILMLLEQNDEWVVPLARYMTLETIAPMGDDAVISLPTVAS